MKHFAIIFLKLAWIYINYFKMCNNLKEKLFKKKKKKEEQIE